MITISDIYRYTSRPPKSFSASYFSAPAGRFSVPFYSTLKVENTRIILLVCHISTHYDIIGVPENRLLKIGKGTKMNYEKVIINTLDSFGVSRSYTGYNYVVYGLLLIVEDRERIECITKSLYLDIAKHFHTNWTCVEKNIRTVVTSVWNSHNIELLEIIFSKSNRTKKPTNKEFLKYMYDYIIQVNNEVKIADRMIPVICPISNTHCEALSAFYIRLSKMFD